MPSRPDAENYARAHPVWCARRGDLGCESSFPGSRWHGHRAQEEGWFFSRKESLAYCPAHVPDWVPEWRARQREKQEALLAENPEFAVLAGEVCQHGEPYEGGMTLRHTASAAKVVCRACGALECPDLMGWSSDYSTLCGEVRSHAVGEGHEVAVSLWNGAIYGPLRED